MTDDLRAIDFLTALEARWAPTLRHEATPVITTPEQHESADVVKGPQTGVMIAFYPSPDQATALAIDGGEAPEELHLTLAYLGNVGAELVEADEPRLIQAVAAWASSTQPVTGIINGVGLFKNPQDVTWASVDAPSLPTARQSLIAALDSADLPALATHGFTPHITLKYGDARQANPPGLQLNFDSVVIAFAGQRTAIALTGSGQEALSEAAAAATFAPLPQITTTTTGQVTYNSTYPVFVNDRPGTDMISTPDVVVEEESAKAFVADINGRTLVTAPATTIAAMKDPTVEDITAEHMLWMHGRFVGAEAPNRNGAFWSAGDLEMAKGSVVNGPLNWLHDAKHVIGTLAKADYINPAAKGASGQGVQRSAELPHITATAAIWKWIYPDESYVVAQASDQQSLWFSMECISKEVSCVGPNGCGNTTTYAQYMAGSACEHVMQRASIRRFVNPVFLGGAVIVPPTRPGWAEADARVMKSANALAEAAFEQAGRPDVSASNWEQLMGQLVRFADK